MRKVIMAVASVAAAEEQGVENSRNPLTGIVVFSAVILDEFSKWSL